MGLTIHKVKRKLQGLDIPSVIFEDTKPRPQDPFFAALNLVDVNNGQPEIGPVPV